MWALDFFVVRTATRVEDLYDRRGPYGRRGGFVVPGVAAWAAGSAVYYLARPLGSTLPALVAAVAIYAVWARRARR